MEKKQQNNTLRKCIVSRELLPKEELLRFVVSPENKVVPDISLDLPGRGIWVKANLKYVSAAIEKNMFSKAAKQKVEVPSNLADIIADKLKQKCLSMLGMACKSGLVVAGFEKVKSTLLNDKEYVLFFAKDGAENSFDKIRSAAKNVKIINVFTSDEMGVAIGRSNAVHVVVKKGSVAKKLCKEVNRFEDYIKNDENI